MMHHVWLTTLTGRYKVASADMLETAMYYAHKYRDEGQMTVKRGNKILAILSAAPANPGAMGDAE